ncbi:MAG: NifB/NifX family molybdenum-iron cluster-binding protein [Desulfobacterales bacterium]
MKIAFPTQVDQGLESPVFAHFGSADYFLIVDDATGSFETIVNADRDHLHGHCQPLAALGGIKVDAVVVGGIGGGALQKLLSSSIKVYRAIEGTLDQNLGLIRANRLPEFSFNMTCAGHGAHGGCAH